MQNSFLVLMFCSGQTDEVHAKDNTRPGASSSGESRHEGQISDSHYERILKY